MTPSPGPSRPLAVFDVDGVLADVRHRLRFVERSPKDWDAFFSAAVDDPPLARSNELNSGPSSSQLANRRGSTVAGRTAEKSGARNGLASCRETTDCGTT